jgi:glycosyltransferase involved in cell wall biosynthesis/TolA-binding protein
MMAKVGILYDNISGNTGDVAIGLSIKKILQEIGVEFDELFPGNFNPNDYDTIIIGGGHIIRPSPDFFYDKFKVLGQHILNAVGILDSPQDLHYLENYKYLTVRSSWDRDRLSYLKKKVHVIPCTTMLLEDLEDFPLTLEGPSLGIHLIPYIFNENQEAQFVEWVSTLPFTVYFIPITHYNQDYIYLRHLSSKIKNSILLPIMKPLEIFTLIGKLDYFIGCSLHGGIFAYRHNVPFILFNYNEKMLYFMKDRGLEQFTFTNLNEMMTSFDKLLKDSPDYSRKISEDRNVLREHVKHLKDILPAGGPNTNSSYIASQANYQIENLQSQLMRLGSQLNIYESHISALTDQLQEKTSRVQTLEQSNAECEAQIASLRSQLQEETSRVQTLEQSNAECEAQIASLESQLQEANSHAQILINEIAEMKKSVVWRATMKFHSGFVEQALPQGSRRRRGYDLGLKSGRILANEGPRSLFWNTKEFVKSRTSKQNDYDTWIRNNEPREYQLNGLAKASKDFRYRPKISIVTPVWNTPEALLRAAIDSVLAQTYDNWELCIADGGSEMAQVARILEEYSAIDERIKVALIGENKGIAGNTNEALSLATGEFVALMDHDDALSPFALHEIVNFLNERPCLKFIYSDEDKIDTKGRRFDPFFKPDWSPDLLFSCGYTNHLGVYRADVLREIGGFRKSFEGSQDYDMLLRFVEAIKVSEIGHIPMILYHWRQIPGSTAVDPYAKNGLVVSAAKKALNDALNRRKIKAEVLDGMWPSSYRIKREILGEPLVSIIIPTKDKLTFLNKCIKSIKEKTTYRNYELIVVDNNSEETKTLSYLESLDARVLRYEEEFNFPRINNFAASQARGDYLVFLNNDTEIITSDWIQSMLEHAQRPEVGAVGCKLLYPNKSIQHAGVVLGMSPDQTTGVAGHIFKDFRYEDAGYFGQINVVRNYSAVTAAAMMMRKNVFLEVEGFNEQLKVCYNDVDLCLRLIENGYLIVYTPYAELYHYESLSRGCSVDLSEAQYMLKRWGTVLRKDPYYSPNLSLATYDSRVNV